MNMLNIFEFCSGVLRHENFFCHQFKSHFGYSKVKFFCHKILFKGLTVNTNTEAITKWTTPTNLKQVLSFLSLAGYSHRFIRDYAIPALPLGTLVKLEHVWEWKDVNYHAFEQHKYALRAHLSLNYQIMPNDSV